MRPDTTMKYMILLYDNADQREIFSSRSDLTEEMDGLLEEIRQSGELVATEPLADPVQTMRGCGPGGTPRRWVAFVRNRDPRRPFERAPINPS